LSDLPKVRIATPADDEEVLSLCRELHEENGLMSLNEGHIRVLLSRAHNKQGSIVGVIGPRGKIEATMCLVIDRMYYTDDNHLTELWIHVGKPYRNSRNAEALIGFGKSCSDKIGIPWVTGIITNNRVAGKVRLYRKFLGFPAGAFFIHNAPWAPGVEPSKEDFLKPLKTKAIRTPDR
jgi:hypothetical protein